MPAMTYSLSLLTGLGDADFIAQGYSFAGPSSSLVTGGYGGNPTIILQGYGVASRTDYAAAGSGGLSLGGTRVRLVDYLIIPSGGLGRGGAPFLPTAKVPPAAGGMGLGGHLAEILFVQASLSVSPGRIPLSATTTVTFHGVGSTWLSTPPTFTPAGVAGVSAGSPTVINDTTATVPVTTGATPGTVTWTESTLGKTTTQTVLNKAPIYLPRRRW